MSEAVDKIAPARDSVGRQGNAATGPRKGEAHRRKEVENDSVDISDEARDRAAGRHRRTILEYLEEEKEK